MNNALLAVTVITLERMDNLTLAVANNSLTGFGKVSENCLAFKPMKEANLIRPDGTPYDKETLLDGLNFEINRRVNEGTFE